MHANIPMAKELRTVVEELEPDRVLQVGDFGFDYRDKFMQAIGEIECPFDWIHGNHDDVPQVLANLGPENNFHQPNVTYIPQGATWEWEGVKFIGIGGAFSIDRAIRSAGTSFWPEAEILTHETMEQIKSVGEVDIMVCHDVPFGVSKIEAFESLNIFNLKQHVRDNSRYFREQLLECFETLNPSLVIHGHWHHYYEGQLQDAKVLGLGSNGERWLRMLEVEDGQWSLWP